jgi:hypothetical protein
LSGDVCAALREMGCAALAGDGDGEGSRIRPSAVIRRGFSGLILQTWRVIGVSGGGKGRLIAALSGTNMPAPWTAVLK